MLDKQKLFYDNKARIEQAWKLLEVAQELVNDVIDDTETTLDGAYDIYETIISANDALYQVYDLNIKLHHDK